MKLHKLVLTNIGPYAGRSELDFDSLDNSLFLITGATGAGKTYIFDSICYALYGKTSGENREPDDLKSKFAGPKDIASIDLYFEYQNKDYLIHREPIQWRQNEKKTNGEYLMSRKAANGQIYILPDVKKPVISKDLDKYIIELFGLDFKQFKMTMMIAQGDFYSLINADTKKREEIFRKILNTEKLAIFSKKLDEKCKEQENLLNSNNKTLETIRNGFMFDGELKENTLNFNFDVLLLKPLIIEELKLEKNNLDELKNNLSEKKNEMLDASNKYNKATTDNNNLDSYLKAKASLEELGKVLPEYEAKANMLKASDKASIYKNALDSFDAENTHLAKLNNDKELCISNINKNKTLLDNLKISLSTAREMLNENDKLIEANSRINSKLDKINELNDLNNKLIEIDKSINNLKDNKNKKAIPLDELNNTKCDLELILAGDKKDIELNNINHFISDIDNKIAEFKNNKAIIDKYINLINVYKENLKSYDIKNNSYKEALNNYDEYERSYHSSLAGILAAKLNDNEPCPVCGSIHHPKKAILSNELSKDELDRLKSISDKSLNEKNNAYTLMMTSLTDVDNIKNQIEKFIPEFNEANIYSKYEDILADMELEKKPLLLTKKELEAYVKKYNEANSNLIIVNNKIDDINKSILEIDNEINKLNNDRSIILGSINQLSDIKNSNEKELRNELTQNNIKIANNKNAYDNALNNHNAVEKELSGLNASLNGINSNIKLANDKLSKLNIDMDNALKDGDFESKEEALNSLLDPNIYNEYKNEGAKFNVEYHALNKLLNDYINSGYDKLLRSDISELEIIKNKKTEEYDAINNSVIDMNNKYSNNERQYNLLINSIKSSEDIRAKYSELKQLADVANGKVNGKRINFEVYYQLQVFDEILKVASYKFNKMSNGRYEMRAGLPKGGNGQIGLEIDVKDLYNGEVRPVSGLSGGESFQASMALALAFSEIIQYKAGGVELNSMFIDEGFGTLDNEMLESTKKTLLEIGNATNRRIGIISHIEELVRSISSKVIVSKSNKGSHFEIKND